MSQQSNQWDFDRFLKTLTYFRAVPLLGDMDWFAQWFGNKTAAPASLASPYPCLDFRQPTEDLATRWGALDDVVMGGVSQSGIRWSEGAAWFSGTVSTANSGGFASIRTRNFDPPLNWAGFAGVKLRVRGEGQRYKFMLRSDPGWDSVAYSYSFDTEAETWIDVSIPFTRFIPVSRARTLENAAPLNLSHICALQLMLSKFEYDGQLNPKFVAGSFQLAIEYIQPY
jgi:hypothetical protein